MVEIFRATTDSPPLTKKIFNITGQFPMFLKILGRLSFCPTSFPKHKQATFQGKEEPFEE